MPHRAKLFATPEGQAVQLPEEYRFDEQEKVLVYKEGRRVILEPERRRWSRRFLKLAGSAPDFPYPDEPPPAESAPAEPLPEVKLSKSRLKKMRKEVQRRLAKKREARRTVVPQPPPRYDEVFAEGVAWLDGGCWSPCTHSKSWVGIAIASA